MDYSSNFYKKVQKFIYDSKESGYQKETFYKKETMYDLYNQPASYAFFQNAFELIKMTLTTNMPIILEKQNTEEVGQALGPVINDLYEARWLLKTSTELNPALNVSVDEAIGLLEEMSDDQPTAEQIDRLLFIHDMFKEINTEQLINQEENQMYSDVAETLRKIHFIP